MTSDRNMDTALVAERAALLVVDVQDKLAAVMPQDGMARLTRNLGILCEAARRFAIPVVVSQQYPRGLGPTVAGVEQALAGMPPEQLHRFDKVEFSVCAAPGFAAVESALDGRDQWIVTGMECHICVYQSARALRAGGAAVHVVRDAVVSRTAENRDTGLGLIERTGALITTTETVVFDLLQRAGGDDFKALSRLVI
ncbi:MAG TPA: isochorismatase family protein [Kofleriaceae bacterium]|nr:isochorismatase family protein [Kofleriaceae bacterium]